MVHLLSWVLWFLLIGLFYSRVDSHGLPHRRQIPPTNQSTCRRPLVEITVSPLIGRGHLRRLELSWELEDFQPGDWVGLHENSLFSRPLVKVPIRSSSGWSRTSVQENREYGEPSFETTCSKFWAAIWRLNSSDPVTSSCLISRPRWMEESREIIKDLRLKDIFLPGTHDSAAFRLAYRPFQESRFDKYVHTQDESVLEQLIHGARYLDLRVGHYNGKFWLNHGFARVHPLEYVLMDIKNFLDNTNEIVVVDIHRFPVGFDDNNAHDKLVSYLKKELSSYFAPPYLGWDATLSRVWATNKSLILSYNKREILTANFDTFWSQVSHKWANVDSLDRLHDYFLDVFQRPPSQAWAAMAELTPQAWGVITDKYQGLRNMADNVNRNVTNWFRGDWGRLCNAVAVDFIRSTGIVEAAIRWNKRRAKKSLCD